MLLAFTVCLLAGSATVLGGMLALHPVVRRPAALGVALAFAAGAMLAISLVEILPRSHAELRGPLGPVGSLVTIGAMFALGAGLVVLADRVLPSTLGPGGSLAPGPRIDYRLLRSAVLVVGIVSLHNLPEGLSTFVATLADPALGISLAIAIAIHNVPEGVAVAAPVYAATGSRRAALGWAAVSGLAEPLGALLGVALLRVVLPGPLFSLTFALIAGMMVTISVRELLPTALRQHTRLLPTALGTGCGGAVMLLSLALLR